MKTVLAVFCMYLRCLKTMSDMCTNEHEQQQSWRTGECKGVSISVVYNPPDFMMEGVDKP